VIGLTLMILFLGAGAELLAAQDGLAGRWTGRIDVAGTTIPMDVVFAVRGDSVSATIDIQGATGLSLQQVRYDPPTLHFELPAGAGLATFDGTHAGDSISGEFKQSGLTGTFVLAPPAAGGGGATATDSLPYRIEDLTFQNDSVTLAGTLTIPEGRAPVPAVVLVSGSGPQDRDETLFGFKPFLILADHLTRNGIAVLRYDDRGVGGSGGNILDATSADFAGDALAGVRLLAGRADVDATRVGIVGHSEGGIVAPIAANRSDQVAFIVTLAGTALSGADILLEQGRLIALAEGAADTALAKQREMQEQLFGAIRTGEGWETVRQAAEEQIRSALEQLPAEQRNAIADPETYIAAQVQGQMQYLQSNWFAFFLDHDPATTLAQVSVPVLAIYGGKDLQVPADLNRQALEGAMRGKDLTVRIFPNANHLFQPAGSGSPSEYAQLEKRFVDDLLPTVTEWILARRGRR
jgi:pimeloyl-ACP methyl ester carboxylesterase